MFSPELNFEFHYFFMRTLWFVDLAEALIVFPDGYGTCDELMKVRALIQTGKIQKKIPILLYRWEYWDEIINFVAMLQWNMVSPENLAFQFVGSRDEAVGYIQRHIREGVAAYCHTPTDAQTNQITSKQALTSGSFE